MSYLSFEEGLFAAGMGRKNARHLRTPKHQAPSRCLVFSATRCLMFTTEGPTPCPPPQEGERMMQAQCK